LNAIDPPPMRKVAAGSWWDAVNVGFYWRWVIAGNA